MESKRDRKSEFRTDSGAVTKLLEEFAAEYKWTVVQTIAHTYYQLKQLSNAAAHRRCDELKMQADLYRIANNGDKETYNRFINGLEQSILKAPVSKDGDPAVPGISYTKES